MDVDELIWTDPAVDAAIAYLAREGVHLRRLVSVDDEEGITRALERPSDEEKRELVRGAIKAALKTCEGGGL